MRKILILLLCVTAVQAQKKMENAVLDLSKVTFKEDVNSLFSGVKPHNESILNGDSKTALGNVYMFNQKSGVKVKYASSLSFHNLKVLTTTQDKIVAFDTFVFYEGALKDIDAFKELLSQKFKAVKPTVGKIAGGSQLYQWETSEFIVQLMRDTAQETESSFVNGKEIEKKTCYVRFSIYKKSMLTSEINKYINENIDFLLYSKKHFSK